MMTKKDSEMVEQDEIMDVEETVRWLKIPRSTLYKMCTDGEIPSAKVGRQWRFHKGILQKWLKGKILANERRKKRSSKQAKEV